MNRRREQACAILWAQVHKDDPDPSFSALSDAQQRQLIDALGLDARPRLREESAEEDRRRPEDPTDDAEEDELECDESESEPESEPPLM